MICLLYEVRPSVEQVGHVYPDDIGASMDQFVWASGPSEAVRLWRDHWGIDGDLGITEPVMVIECPVMVQGSPSTVVSWDDILSFLATVTQYEFVEPFHIAQLRNVE
ncbi:hypothetical protein Q2941_02815 [Bradyrhizobium sp. UFLA05-153]